MTANADQLAAAWLEDDRRRARDAREAGALEASRAARHWIVALWLEHAGASRDGSSGFAQLGRVLAAADVSCATALESVSTFARHVACSEVDLATARAAVVDAYTEARLEQARDATRARFDDAWIELGPGVGAVVACPPEDDDEWLSEWADRMAAALLRRKVRHAHVRAPERARSCLAAAFELVGIEIRDGAPREGAAPEGDGGAPSGGRGFWSRLLR